MICKGYYKLYKAPIFFSENTRCDTLERKYICLLKTQNTGKVLNLRPEIVLLDSSVASITNKRSVGANVVRTGRLEKKK